MQVGQTIQSQGADLANKLIASALTVINAPLFIVVVRGRATVCGILGTYYAVVLSLAGLIVGAIAGGVLAIGLALFQFWDQPWIIALIVAIFLIGQFVEGNILSPNLVGHSVGLHPVGLLLALSAFGTLLGFLGLLVAVPVAATIGVLARFGVRKYLKSQLYRGTHTPDPGRE